MSQESLVKTREVWVDYVKVLACVLVALGHFFQSMTKAEIVPTSDAFLFFNQVIYSFHVPLFFICSGYLYQKFSVVRSFGAWKVNILKKLLALGVPFVVFSTATWVLKNVFSGSVNSAESESLLSTLLIEPTAPYWFLYILFFLFLITPTMAGEKEVYICLAVSFALKIAQLTLPIHNYALHRICGNEIWFVLGMAVCALNLTGYARKKWFLWVGLACMAVFCVGSAVGYDSTTAFWSEQKNFLMGLPACAGIGMVTVSLFRDGKHFAVLDFFAKYTMPVFLMHTIFAAAFRSVLMKVGIHSAPVHVAAGLAVCFVCPIIAAMIMERIWFLNFFLYPGKVLKKMKHKAAI